MVDISPPLLNVELNPLAILMNTRLTHPPLPQILACDERKTIAQSVLVWLPTNSFPMNDIRHNLILFFRYFFLCWPCLQHYQTSCNSLWLH